jgi:hypothetical protein
LKQAFYRLTVSLGMERMDFIRRTTESRPV